MASRSVVVDTGPLIRGNLLNKFSGTKLFTVQDVLNEVRDKRTRENLEALPFEIEVREPSPEAINRVVSFAKQTGDFASLSKPDMRVIALAVTLELEQNGAQFLRVSPPDLVQWDPAIHGADDNDDNEEEDKKVAGTFDDPNDEVGGQEIGIAERDETSETIEEEISGECTISAMDNDRSTACAATVQKKKRHRPRRNRKKKPKATMAEESCDSAPDIDCEEQQISEVAGKEQLDMEQTATQEEKRDEAEKDEDDESEEEWITADNLHEKISSNVVPVDMHECEAGRAFVACCTNDFAMQNVLIQMGLPLMSLDGMRIRRVKKWMLKCHGCFKPTNKVDAKFCPQCGLQTLRRVSVHVNADGSMTYYEGRRTVCKKGMRYPIPRPKPGRANQKTTPVVMSEDELLKYQRHKKKKKDQEKEWDLLDADSAFEPGQGSTSREVQFQPKRNVNQPKSRRRRFHR